MNAFDKVKQTAAAAADTALRAADEVAGKGRRQMRILTLSGQLNRAQQQLGALIYALRKNKAENEALVERYVEAIADIEAELAELRGAGARPEEGKAAASCPVCGAAVDPDALFCPACGEKL